MTDTGKGIPPEVQKRLFDPFFTTKEGGTGLGLAIAARIVEKHGGLLRYKTETNRGATFEIVLPGTGDDATKNTARLKMTRAPPRRCRRCSRPKATRVDLAERGDDGLAPGQGRVLRFGPDRFEAAGA